VVVAYVTVPCSFPFVFITPHLSLTHRIQCNSTTGGSITINTGASEFGTSDSGEININTGRVSGAAAGSINIAVGDAFDSRYAQGGSVSFSTGYSENGSSGTFSIETANGGRQGVLPNANESGDITMKTGNSRQGRTGSFRMTTGDAEVGQAGGYKHRCFLCVLVFSYSRLLAIISFVPLCTTTGSFELNVGYSKSNFDGGSIRLHSGETWGSENSGGHVDITAGDARSSTTTRGASSKGGVIDLTAGMSSGPAPDDDGGSISIVAGHALGGGDGGYALFQSGGSTTASSGPLCE
jgi:hypothetical protein